MKSRTKPFPWRTVLALVALLLLIAWCAYRGTLTNIIAPTILGFGAGAAMRRHDQKREELRKLEQEEQEERRSHTDAVVLELELRAAADKKINAPAQQAPTDLWDKNAKLPPP